MLSGVLIAATWHVPTQVPTIQEAIDAAVSGDTVLVDRGHYHQQLDYRGKALVVRGIGGAFTTALDGTGLPGSVVSFRNGEGRDSMLEGFEVRGGRAERGGGLYIAGASPTIRACLLSDNDEDVSGDGLVNATDLLLVLAAWGLCP